MASEKALKARIHGRVKLYTKEVKLVVEAQLPPFDEWPDVLVWGSRLFAYSQGLNVDQLEVAYYVEAFTAAVVPEMEVQ